VAAFAIYEMASNHTSIQTSRTPPKEHPWFSREERRYGAVRLKIDTEKLVFAIVAGLGARSKPAESQATPAFSGILFSKRNFLASLGR
jgi:hypothetical protein